ncbi:MAG TPA: VOC family protein [Candidatus Saccharimonadales bacterium]|nr:VOC family protein [Candidatus Saccharimonadales bacterium]
MKVTNVLFWVADNTVSVKFYKKLGFAVVRSDHEYSEVELGGFKIGLITMRDDAEFAHDALAGERGKGMYVYVGVDDVDAKYEELKNLGIQASAEPRDWPWGNREFVVKDPDGYKLCFWAPKQS